MTSDPYEQIDQLKSRLDTEQIERFKVQEMFTKLVKQHAALVSYVKTLGGEALELSPTIRGRGYHPEKIDYIARHEAAGPASDQQDNQVA